MDDDDALYESSSRAPNLERPSVTERIGVGAGPDEDMERFAHLVQYLFGVPAAVVSLMEEDRHILPGLVGLGEPWSSSRQVGPTSEEEPVRPDQEAGQDPAAPVAKALGAVSWAGAPLTDAEGRVLGFLIAMDTAARTWKDRERDALHALAHVCGAELRLRLLVHESRKNRAQAQRAYERSQMLLRTADELAGATGPVLVRRAVKALLTTDLDPTHVEIFVVEGERLSRVFDPEDPSTVEEIYEECDLDSTWPQAVAIRTDTVVEIPDRAAIEAQPPEVREAFARMGLASAVYLPLFGNRDPIGVLTLGWDVPHEVEVVERALLRSLAEYTARAMERAVYVSTRVQAAESMQRAMLTEVPDVDGLQIEALYRPAARGATVGGDWYDAYPLRDDESGTLAITVGDITGHDLRAAILMGQVRTMLRQADLDHPDHGPARIFMAFERANRELGLDASGTMVHAHLKPDPRGWLFTWTNAGHPGPLVALRNGDTHQLTEHDLLFHPALPAHLRTDHQWLLEPGSTLLMFTDGLIEHRHGDMDVALAHTASMLGSGRHEPLPELLRSIAATNVGEERGDDVVLLAVRLAETAPL